MSAGPSLETVEVPALRELARRLLAHGASPRLARRVIARVEARDRRAEPLHPLDVAAEELGAAFPPVALRAPAGGTLALALFGTRGAGRSSVARKLASRLRAAGRAAAAVALAQASSTKPAWLAAWFVEQGLAAEVAPATGAFPASVASGASIVLVDGSGDVRADARAIRAWERAHPRLDWRRAAVMATDGSLARLRAEARALRALGADCAVLTRADLATAPAAALEICAEHGLAPAFVCNGARDDAHLHRVGPDLAADVFLKGRVA